MTTCCFAIREWLHRQMGGGCGDVGSVFWLQSKMLLLLSPLGFRSHFTMWALSNRVYPQRSVGGNTNKHHRHLSHLWFCSLLKGWFCSLVMSVPALLLCVSVWIFIWVVLTTRTINRSWSCIPELMVSPHHSCHCDYLQSLLPCIRENLSQHNKVVEIAGMIKDRPSFCTFC